MEPAISVTIILFILSMINERICNFIKLQYSDKRFGKFSFGNLSTKMNDENLENDRTKRIIALNIVCGTIVALLMQANLISILGHLDKPYEVIGWNGELPEGWHWLLLPVGCFLTGCFISLGSKFWHDLLDLLLYTKNLKEKLVDERTYNLNTSVEEITVFINTPEYKLSQIGVDKYAEDLKKIPGVLAVGPGYLDQGKNKIGCIEVHVTQDSVARQIPQNLPIRLVTSDIPIPIKVVVTGGYPSVNAADAGKGVANKSGVLGSGTIGAVMKDKNDGSTYLLSCFHVLNGDFNWSRLSDSTDIVDETGTSIAELYFGFRTTDMDAAIAKVNNGVSFSNTLINNPTSVREVVYNDALQGIRVTILGAKTNSIVNGFVYNNCWRATFKYPGGSLWELNDLIVLTQIDQQLNAYRPITKSGDSGALVIDNNNIAIGLVVGADDSFSYAIKLDKIARTMNITF